MGTPRDQAALRFYRAAKLRLDDGKLVSQRLERHNAAIYLTGYAVECILKALLLQMAPAGRRGRIIASFRGRQGHDLELLKRKIAEQGQTMDRATAGEFALLRSWTTDLRYEPSMGNPGNAARFIKAAEAIWKWADRRI